MKGARTNSAKSGAKAEGNVASELTARGFSIKERNYHSRFGEIDIIAENGELIVFVEVKYRKSAYYGVPSEAVNMKKQHKIIKTAQIYLQEKDLWEIPTRFDIAEVSGSGYEINIIEGAFDLISAKYQEDCF